MEGDDWRHDARPAPSPLPPASSTEGCYTDPFYPGGGSYTGVIAAIAGAPVVGLPTQVRVVGVVGEPSLVSYSVAG